jgi:hypothetical protein
MKHLILLAAAVLFASVAYAQPLPDHLQCHKVKDTQKFREAQVTLDAIQLAFQMPENCTIKGKGREFCVPVIKTVVASDAPGSQIGPGQDLSLNDYVCYKMKCPKTTHADELVTDQFGVRVLEKIKAPKRICVPAVKGTPPTTIPCEPDCTGLQCGDDGCNGSCGDCAAGEICNANGLCECVPDCTGLQCGDDGCNGSCGDCAAGEICNANGLCECVPDCTGLQCGDDGCNGSCGDCAAGEICNVNGLCECVPDCTGLQCGDDGCNGSCGDCAQGETCVDGVCEPPTPICGDDAVNQPSEECDGIDNSACPGEHCVGCQCSGVPVEWTCTLHWYGDGSDCDCGCGIIDPDCLDATVGSCDFCTTPGSCSAISCPGEIDPDNNAVCASTCGDDIVEGGEECDGSDNSACPGEYCVGCQCSGVPVEWTCNPNYYGAGDGCDCGCGIIDPDCLDATVGSCQFCNVQGSCSSSSCPGEIDPDNNAVCVSP